MASAAEPAVSSTSRSASRSAPAPTGAPRIDAAGSGATRPGRHRAAGQGRARPISSGSLLRARPRACRSCSSPGGSTGRMRSARFAYAVDRRRVRRAARDARAEARPCPAARDTDQPHVCIVFDALLAALHRLGRRRRDPASWLPAARCSRTAACTAPSWLLPLRHLRHRRLPTSRSPRSPIATISRRRVTARAMVEPWTISIAALGLSVVRLARATA